ncbi:MAG: DUF6049 family protein [Pyrinomonadaceae bacterium]
MVRPSPPRFLNFGDQAELPVVIQNQTDAPMETSIAVRAVNADLTAGAGRRVTVPANDQVEVRFPVAAVAPGTAFPKSPPPRARKPMRPRCRFPSTRRPPPKPLRPTA